MGLTWLQRPYMVTINIVTSFVTKWLKTTLFNLYLLHFMKSPIGRGGSRVEKRQGHSSKDKRAYTKSEIFLV